MTEFQEVIDKIENEEHKETFLAIIHWVDEHYPKLVKSIKWSQPCYEDNGTFIIAFTPFKAHMAINLEKTGIKKFEDKLDQTDYSRTDMTFRIKWNQAIDYDLLSEMIDFQINDKEGYTTYWRKA